MDKRYLVATEMWDNIWVLHEKLCEDRAKEGITRISSAIAMFAVKIGN